MTSETTKITVVFKAVGEAPSMKVNSFRVNENDTVFRLLQVIRKQLKLTEPIHLFVNQAFSPSLEHTVKILKDCYAPNDEKLFIYYSITPAWG